MHPLQEIDEALVANLAMQSASTGPTHKKGGGGGGGGTFQRAGWWDRVVALVRLANHAKPATRLLLHPTAPRPADLGEPVDCGFAHPGPGHSSPWAHPPVAKWKREAKVRAPRPEAGAGARCERATRVRSVRAGALVPRQPVTAVAAESGSAAPFVFPFLCSPLFFSSIWRTDNDGTPRDGPYRLLQSSQHLQEVRD